MEVYLLQVFSVKRRVSQKRGGSEGSERLARFSLSGVLGLLREQKQAAGHGFKATVWKLKCFTKLTERV